MYPLGADMGFYGYIVTFRWSAAGSRNKKGECFGTT